VSILWRAVTTGRFHIKRAKITVTNSNLIQDEIKRLNSDNASYHPVQNLQTSRLLSKNVKIKIYNILPVVL
jgi:hypothetical protein